MRMKDQKVRDALAEQAAEWFVVNREAPGATEREEFLQWLKTSPLNIEEFDYERGRISWHHPSRTGPDGQRARGV